MSEVIDVLVKVGDSVEVDTPLITIETEKATMDAQHSRRARWSPWSRRGHAFPRSVDSVSAGAGAAPASG
jgi:hypothetical protein